MPAKLPEARSEEELRKLAKEDFNKKWAAWKALSGKAQARVSRAEEAARIAAAIGIAYEEDRRRAMIMRAKARAEERFAQRYAEGRL